MKIDIFGIEPKVGDIIVFNPPRYKGIVSAQCVSLSKEGHPRVMYDNSYSAQTNSDGTYSPRTGYVIVKRF